MAGSRLFLITYCKDIIKSLPFLFETWLQRIIRNFAP